jgi:uncharacterized protein YcbK (DUF882 family)
MGSRVPANSASNLSSPVPLSWIGASRNGPWLGKPWRIGSRLGLAALMVLLGNHGLETAEANGDTRTISLHHLHTDENITITYKRDGRYDEDAIKKLDHFLRDWRKDESTHMDPRLFDVVWEVSREFGKDKIIQVVCGYRSPSTNAMLRRRSSGVAQFSQHTLGKAMDFYIQNASLEEIREAGLRLQRGGVGYYPTSGSPFVHLDVGSIRHWPRMSREQLARVFPNGRTVHVPSDGQPLHGYALALADIQKRGSSPSQMSLASAQSAGVDASTVRSARPKGVLASLFHTDEDEDGRTPAPTAGATASGSHTFSLASVSDPKTSDLKAEPARSAAAARPQRTALAAVEASTGSDDGVAAPAGRDPWATAGMNGAPRPPGEVRHAPMTNPDVAPAVTPWPFRDADRDRVPLDMVLAYAAEPQRGDGSISDAHPAMGRDPVRGASGPARSIAPRETSTRETAPAAAKKSPARTQAAAPVVPILKVTAVAATPGMRYDDPWLRAMILAPRLYGAMTATFYGDADLTELRSLMSKPTSAVAMSFSHDPNPGLTSNGFSGEAIVALSTVTFSQRTAWLQ